MGQLAGFCGETGFHKGTSLIRKCPPLPWRRRASQRGLGQHRYMIGRGDAMCCALVLNIGVRPGQSAPNRPQLSIRALGSSDIRT